MQKPVLFGAVMMGVLSLVILGPVITSRGADGEWTAEYTQRPFVLRADHDAPDLTDLCHELLEVREAIEAQLQLQPGDEWIEVYLFRNQAAYRKFVSRHFPGNESRRALYVRGRGPGMIFLFRDRSLTNDLRHEAAHAILDAAGARPPLWLDEGLAEYFEEAADQRLSGTSHIPEVLAALRAGQLPTLVRLEATTELTDFELHEYQAAWAWTHFLLHGPDEYRAVLRRRLSEGADQGEVNCFSETILGVSADAEQAMLRHHALLESHACETASSHPADQAVGPAGR